MPKRNGILSALGLNLRRQRKAGEFIREKLAERADLDPTYISRSSVACAMPASKTSPSSLMNFDYGHRYPDAAAEFVAATHSVYVGATVPVVSVFMDHAPAHQGRQGKEPGQYHQMQCFHDILYSQSIANPASVVVTRSTDGN